MTRRVSLAILACVLIALLGLVVGATSALAQEEPTTTDPIQFTPQVPLPGFSGSIPVDEDLLPKYIAAFYTYFLGAVGIIAVVMIMYGGFRWITAAGNPGRIGAAKETIQSAVIGLILALTSRLILQTINPDLVSLRIGPLEAIKQNLQLGTFCTTPAARAAAQGQLCNTRVSYQDSTGREAICIATDCHLARETCQYSQSAGQYKCQGLSELCRSGGNCRESDSRLASIDPPPMEGNHRLVCALVWDVPAARGDVPSQPQQTCQPVAMLECASNETRRACNFGVGDSPCWVDGARAQSGSGRYTSYCQDPASLPRPGVEADLICCARDQPKSQVACSPSAPNVSYNEVPCGTYNGLPGQFSGIPTETCPEKCWAELVLKATN